MVKNISIGQYFPGDSFVHRLDPRLKLYSMLLFIISIFFIESFLVYIPVVILILSTILVSKLPLKMILKSLKGVMFIVLMTVVLNIFLTPGEIIFKYWIFSITKEGVRISFFMAIRITLLIMGTSVLTLTTSPIALADGLEYSMKPLEKLRFPSHAVAMMMTIALRFIPTILEEMDKIVKAQTSRGADFESGNLIKRAKNLVPLLVPLFINAFRRAEELAVAMESRCYRGGEGRTKMRALKYSKKDYITMFFITFFFAGIIACKYIF